jgi:hypothetical protein
MYFGLQQTGTISPHVRLTGHMIKREEYFYIAGHPFCITCLRSQHAFTTYILKGASKSKNACARLGSARQHQRE